MAAKTRREPQKCAICPKLFIPARKDAKYCSGTCRSRANSYKFTLAGGR